MSDRIKVFISQPMAGKDDNEIEAEREGVMSLMRQILGEGVEEVPSWFKGSIDRGHMKPLRMLGMALELMSDADVVVFADGWEEGRGCRIEHECAVQYGYKVIDLSGSQYEGELE